MTGEALAAFGDRLPTLETERVRLRHPEARERWFTYGEWADTAFFALLRSTWQ